MKTSRFLWCYTQPLVQSQCKQSHQNHQPVCRKTAFAPSQWQLQQSGHAKQHHLVQKLATSQSKLPTRGAKTHSSKAILLNSDTRGAKMKIATKKTLPRGSVFVFLRCFVEGAFCKFKQRVFVQVFAKIQPLLANYCACSTILISSKIVWSCSASS